MAQYCSLQEAYNLPAVPRKKKSCATKSPEEPYDSYTEIQGKEQVLYERFQSGETPSGVSSRPVAGAPSGRGLGGDSGYEGSRKTYASQVTDYDYICSNGRDLFG